MIEYERRFFAEVPSEDTDGTSMDLSKTQVLTQGYLTTGAGGATVRIRAIVSHRPERFVLTVKLPRTDGGKGVQEFEVDVDAQVGGDLLRACGNRIIQKVRYTCASGWEVDSFSGFVIAEFEGTEDEVDSLELPPWILREIRPEEGLSNAALATDPDKFEAAAAEWRALVADRRG